VSGRRPRGEVPRDLPRGNAGCAVDPQLQREAIHDAYRAHRGIAPVVQRPDSHSGALHRGAGGAMSYKTIHRARHHFGWNNAFEPALRIAAGETLACEVVDASGGQLSKTSTTKDVAALDFARVNPVTGPVDVEGAQRGGALGVALTDWEGRGWGGTA